jgi:hypothetical protein
LLEIGTDEDNGLITIRAAGHYYQRIMNLAGANLVEGARQVRE